MNELSAAAPPRDSPAARGGQRRREPDARQAQLHDVSSSPYAHMDAEMLEVVMTFERVYADLEPPREAPDPDETLLSDDLFPPFPEDFDIPQAPRRSAETARVLSVWPEREIVRSITPAGRVAPAAQQTLDIDLDEAMSILRDAEEKGRAASMESRYHEPEMEPERDPDEGLNVTMPEPVVQRSAARAVVQPPGPAADRPHADERTHRPAQPYFLAWSVRSHRLQSFAIGGAIAALIVGLALGYTIGRVSDFPSARAKVHASEPGSPHLRVDYELR